MAVRRLHEEPAPDALEVVGLRAARKAHRHHPNVGFGGKDLSCFGVEVGRDHDFDELLGHRLGHRRVELAVKGNDASERWGGDGAGSALSRAAWVSALWARAKRVPSPKAPPRSSISARTFE